jgi:hypothetical protein
VVARQAAALTDVIEKSYRKYDLAHAAPVRFIPNRGNAGKTGNAN